MQTEKEAAKLQRGIRSLEAHLLAKNTFVEAFELQSCSLIDGMSFCYFLKLVCRMTVPSSVGFGGGCKGWVETLER